MPDVTLSTDIDAFLKTANDAAARTELGLGSAAEAATGDFATAAEGILAGTALQPADPTLESVTDNGATTLNDIQVGRIVTAGNTLGPVATAVDSIAIGGTGNSATGPQSEVLGGGGSSATATGSTIVGGNSSNNSGNWAIIAGGRNHTNTAGARSGILGGEYANVTHADSSMLSVRGTAIANKESQAVQTAHVDNLHIFEGGFKMPTGATDTYVLTTDATGVGTWQENQTAVTDLGVQADTNAAESAMITNGFYTWTEADPDAYRQLSFKDSTKIWHIKEIINDNLIITVGGVGDDFATPADANRYLSHFDIAHNITVQVLIRPGTYTNQFSIFGHPHGERIFYKPFDAAAEPSSFPITSDFSTGTGDIVADEAMLRSKYPVVIETNTIDPGLRAGSGKTLIFRNCLFIGSAGTDKDGAFADEGAHIDCQGCTFFRFKDGIAAESGSDIRCPQVAAAWCSRIGFYANGRSLFRSSTNPGATIVWCNEGVDIYNSFCEINNIDLFKIQNHGIEVRHHSSFGENDSINVTADFCCMDGIADAVIAVRRNSYAKISNVNITNNITAGVRVYGNGHIYMSSPAVISTPSDGTSGAIEMASFGTIETNYGTPADFATDFTPILVAGNPVTPTATGVGNDYSYDGGVYGSILIT